jgi:predicted component of type VI protein secretion system
MNDTELRDLLTQLHARLGSARSLRGEDRELLVTVLGDIEKLLEKSEQSARPDVPGLESLAVKFEAEHPAVADGLRRLADTLGKAGI